MEALKIHETFHKNGVIGFHVKLSLITENELRSKPSQSEHVDS